MFIRKSIPVSLLAAVTFAIFALVGVHPAAAVTMSSVSVREFGAVGNGVADDSAAIQAAFRVAGPRTVVFPAGTYRFSRVVVTSDTSIVFEDGAVGHLRTDSLGYNYFFATWGNSSSHKARVSLQGGRFSGPAYAVFWAQYTDDVSVSGVTSEGTDRLIQAVNSSHVTVTGCTAVGASVGFHFLRSTYLTVTGCTARNMKLDGVLFYDRCSHIVADRNLVDGYALSGSLYRAGIHIYGSTDATITNNTVLNGRSDSTGIRFRDANTFWCAYNTVTSPGNRGLATARVGDFSGVDTGAGTFFHNTVTQAKLFGIDIYPSVSKPVRVIDNIVRYTKTPSGASYAATALRICTSGSVAIGNVLEYTDGIAIRIQGSGILLVRNTIYQPLLLHTGQLVGIRVLGTGHAIVENTITDTLHHMTEGIVILPGVSALLRSNTVTGASRGAVLLQGKALSSIGGDTVRPTVTFSATPSGTDATVTLTAADDKAAVNAITYKVDNGPRVTISSSTGSFVVSGTGIHVVKYSAIDRAGNTSAWVLSSVLCP